MLHNLPAPKGASHEAVQRFELAAEQRTIDFASMHYHEFVEFCDAQGMPPHDLVGALWDDVQNEYHTHVTAIVLATDPSSAEREQFVDGLHEVTQAPQRASVRRVQKLHVVGKALPELPETARRIIDDEAAIESDFNLYLARHTPKYAFSGNLVAATQLNNEETPHRQDLEGRRRHYSGTGIISQLDMVAVEFHGLGASAKQSEELARTQSPAIKAARYIIRGFKSADRAQASTTKEAIIRAHNFYRRLSELQQNIGGSVRSKVDLIRSATQAFMELLQQDVAGTEDLSDPLRDVIADAIGLPAPVPDPEFTLPPELVESSMLPDEAVLRAFFDEQ